MDEKVVVKYNEGPSKGINTAINFSLATITAELAKRAVEIAERNVIAEKGSLNFFRKFMRNAGEHLIKGYSTETLEEAKRIKEKEIEGHSTSTEETERTVDDLQVGGIKKRKNRTRKKSKTNRTKRRSNKRTNKKITNKKRTNKKRTNKNRTNKIE